MELAQIGKARVNFSSLIIEGEAGRYSVEPKVLDVLHTLMEHQGEVVSRDDLIDEVWGVEFGGDERLSRAISLLRKAFGDKRGEHRHIETISKRGYRLIAPVNGKQKDDASDAQVTFAPSPNSIAVLPFVDMSAKSDQEHFADGMTEELLNALSQVPELQVTGRTSSFAFKDQNKDIREIAETLKVAHVIEGSLRKQGDKVRITAQLIKAEDGYHLWSDTYDDDLQDIFHLQERIARSILDELSRFFDIASPEPVVSRKTENPKAYAAFIEGRELYHKRIGQLTLPTAIKHFENAVALDPKYSDAWAGLSMAHFVLPEYSHTPDWAKHMNASRKALQKVDELDSSNFLAKLTRAYIFEHELRFDKAIKICEQALEENPGDSETEVHLALALMAVGLHQLAEPYILNTMPNNPLSPIYPTLLGAIMRASGDIEKAHHYYKRAFDLGYGPAAIAVATLNLQMGAPESSIRFIKDYFPALDPMDQKALQSPINKYWVFGAYFKKQKLHRWIVNGMLKRRFEDPDRQATATSIAGFLLVDNPVLWMKNILEKPNPYVAYSVSRVWDPIEECANIRQHKDFPAFAERIGLVRAWQIYGWPTDGSNLQLTIV